MLNQMQLDLRLCCFGRNASNEELDSSYFTVSLDCGGMVRFFCEEPLVLRGDFLVCGGF